MAHVFHLLNPSLPNVPWVKATAGQNGSLGHWAFVAREHPHHTETLVDWCLKEKVGRLVVWGGDGTLHRVVRALWQRDALARVELALVPVGTCNDLARRLGLARDCWRRWEAEVPQGRLASLALGHARWKATPQSETLGEDIFINNAGFGRPRASFERGDGPLRVLQSFRPIRLTARWADGEMRGLYYMALACLSPYFSKGLHFEKNINPEDGVLRTYFVPARSKLRLGFRLLRGRMGYPLFDSKASKISATVLSLETNTPVWPQADGEPPPKRGVRHVEFRVLPERVRLWVTH
jgi:diacylglycerol kinase family enzyme